MNWLKIWSARVPPVICNTTPLIALRAIERLSILHDLFGEVLIPSAVEHEFLVADSATRRMTLDDSPWIKVRSLAEPAYALTFSSLDRGEAEVLALALELNARLVIIDERAARKFAQRLALPMTGTLGVLLLAKETGHLSALRPEIERMQNAGLRLDADLITAVLRRAGEAQS